MHLPFMRRCLSAVAIVFAVALALALCACGSGQSSDSIRIGTMPTEDILPLWVAQDEGLFEDAGVDAEIVVFDSAPALSAALTAGEVDIAMTDPMRAVKLCESGTPVTLEWVTLGTTPAQGVFGVLASPDNGIASLQDLVTSEKGIGLAANTVPEYVFDSLCEQQGIDPASIVANEVASLPDRYSLVASGQLDAAALPHSLLALGEASGMVVIADDGTGDNVSQSVMVVRDVFDSEQAQQALAAVRAVWDEAASRINADPERYRDVLIANANLNEAVADSYPISVYPMASTESGEAARPAADVIVPVLEWMRAKGYLQSDVSYDEATGAFAIL